jgi:hypothetical protein
MEKHNFKIGDKVKLKDWVRFSCKGKVLIVVKEAEDDFSRYIHVTYEGVWGSYFPLLPDEIEPAIKVGEQLMFSFMTQ